MDRIKQAVSLFWGAVVTAFPEMTSGDSQLSGEDEAAFSLWLHGHPGDNPTVTFDLPVLWVSQQRISEALDTAMSKAAQALFDGEPPAAPEQTKALLLDCIKHVLHWNKPKALPAAVRSISDDDLCAGCQHCDFRPGEMSGCQKDWPCDDDACDYVTHCVAFVETDHQLGN